MSAPTLSPPVSLDCRGRALDVGPGCAHVMGILNVTPDSFSDGGRYGTVEAALQRATEMTEAGAAILDVGGESTRPGAPAVALDEEMARVVPVVEAVARHLPHVLISVDTYKAPVARAALRAGAHMVNDVTGLRDGVETAVVAAEYGAALVVMHSLERTGGPPPTATPPASGTGAAARDAEDRGAEARDAETGTDVVEHVARALAQAADRAAEAGVRSVVVDPGFGFGKTPEQNLRLIERLDRLVADGRPVLVGVSRKSTIGTVLGRPRHPAPVGDRLYGSLALASLAVTRGASIVRAHDVRATVETLRVLQAARRAGADERAL